MIKIPLGQGKFAQVDDCDFDLASFYIWDLHSEGYVRRHVREHGKIVRIYLHIEIAKRIFGCLTLPEVDHANRNKLDCQRSNLRQATNSQNMANTDGHSDNKTGLKGVSYRKGKFISRLRANGKDYHLGTFDSAEEAARVYDKKALEVCGKFACISGV